MKKIIGIMLVAALGLTMLTSCTTATAPKAEATPAPEAPKAEATPAAETPNAEATPAPEEAKASGYELALVTDVGTIDDKSFNQGSWEGLEKYAKENNKTYKYYQPAEKTTDAYLSTIDLAIKGGAKLIVCPGFLFEPAVFKAQEKYPDTKFIILDGFPQNGEEGDKNVRNITNNTYSVFYKEEQSGFLAGYAAVKDGYKKLGFMGGMAVPAVIRFGHGFVQGAEYAAKEMNVSDLEVKYTYVGTFSPSPEVQAKAASWYQSGTEVVFACGGGAGNSVMAAAEGANAKVIGVDVDQGPESASVITSAVKMLGTSVYDGIDAFYKGSFPGGKSVSLGADVDGCGLPMATSKFNTFNQADYDAIFAKLAAGEITLMTDMNGDAQIKVTEIPVTAIKVVELA